ncbi:MAG TPA: response regulator [Phototrophicaceae bacterium]|nr:response regulator [Phototrophicaceae bacterium]
MLLQGKRIFIVEDNPLNRATYQMVTVLHGAQLEFERWGRDTLRRLKQVGQVDLVILDLMLPGGVSGYDVFQEIHNAPEFAAIPIIAVSAAEPSTALVKTRQLGFSGFIAKPIDDDLFPKQLAQILAGKQVWDAGNHL